MVGRHHRGAGFRSGTTTRVWHFQHVEHRRELGLEDLDRDLPVVLFVVREIHGGHAARAELALEAVAAGERGGLRIRRLEPAPLSKTRADTG